MAQLSNPKSLKKKITASRLCLFEKKLQHSDQIGGGVGEESCDKHRPSKTHTHIHTPRGEQQQRGPFLWPLPAGGRTGSGSTGQAALQLPIGIADAHQRCRYPSELQIPIGIRDAQRHYRCPAFPPQGPFQPCRRCPFPPQPNHPSRWPQHPASATYLSIRSINKRLFLNSINWLFFFFSCDCCWISSIFVPSGKRGSVLLQYLIPRPLKHSNGLDQDPAGCLILILRPCWIASSSVLRILL